MTTCKSTDNIRLISISLIVLSITSKYFPYAAGWFACAGASLIFGGTGIPMKDPALQSIKSGAVLFAMYNCLGTAVVNFPITIYLLCVGSFEFKPWAILGNLDIILIVFLAFSAVDQLGYAKAPAIWCSIGMISSFLEGSFIFNEPAKNFILEMIAIIILISGVVVVLSCKQIDNDRTDKNNIELSTSTRYTKVQVKEDEETVTTTSASLESLPSITDSEEENIKIENFETSKNERNKQKSYEFHNISSMWTGLALCLTVGFLDGSLMVPFKLSKAHSILETFQYLSSFGLSSFIVVPVFLSLYVGFIDNQLLHDSALRISFFPGLTSGMLWAFANFMSVHGTYYLGVKIGFPLTQTCVVFSALWGIFYFKEMRLFESFNYLRLSFGVASVIVGALLLSM